MCGTAWWALPCCMAATPPSLLGMLGRISYAQRQHHSCRLPGQLPRHSAQYFLHGGLRDLPALQILSMH